MKAIVTGVLSLIVLNLNAQKMKEPKDVVIGLFIATDQSDWETVKQSFSNQVLLDYSSMNGNPATQLSPEQIVGSWKGILPGFEHTHHQLGNFMSSVSGNKAEILCYGTATHYLKDDQGSLWTVVGTYDFGLISQGGSWRITSMKFNFKYQEGNTSLPQKAINRLK